MMSFGSAGVIPTAGFCSILLGENLILSRQGETFPSTDHHFSNLAVSVLAETDPDSIASAAVYDEPILLDDTIFLYPRFPRASITRTCLRVF